MLNLLGKFPLLLPLFMLMMGISVAKFEFEFQNLIYGALVIALVIRSLSTIQFSIVMVGFFGIGVASEKIEQNHHDLFQWQVVNSKAILVESLGEVVERVNFTNTIFKFKVHWIALDSQNLRKCNGELGIKLRKPIERGKIVWVHPKYLNYSANGEMFIDFDQVYDVNLKYFMMPLKWRSSILDQIFYQSQLHLTKKNRDWYKALIWGNRSELERADRIAFQKMGLAHVISVSGMHLALIFNLLMWPLGLIESKFKNAVKYRWLLLPVIWVYIWLTPASPPIIRAGMALSFMVLSKSVFNRKVWAPNVYFSVIFLYLIFEPEVLFDVSFQLSLLAMWGIVFLLPQYSVDFENRPLIIRWMLNSILVSVVCTLSTLPVVFMAFEQLSLWFILGNLILMPFFTWLIYGYVAFFLLNVILSEGFIEPFVGLLNAFFHVLDSMLSFFVKLPDWVVFMPRWSWKESLLSILALILWFVYKQVGQLRWKFMLQFTLVLLSVQYVIGLYICM